MHQSIEYKDRSIDAGTSKVGQGYTWTYQIDSGPLRACTDRLLPDETMALNEAIREARAEIDLGS